MEFLKNYVKNIKEGFVPDDDTKGFKEFISRIKNLWKHSRHGKITIILISYLILTNLFSSSNEGSCKLAGCDREGQGWNYYSTSQGSMFGMEMIGCVRKYETGGYCSKNHCAEGL